MYKSKRGRNRREAGYGFGFTGYASVTKTVALEKREKSTWNLSTYSSRNDGMARRSAFKPGSAPLGSATDDRKTRGIDMSAEDATTSNS